MRLIRFGNSGSEKPGLELADGRRKDCSSWFTDWNGDFFAGGGLDQLSAQAGDIPALPDLAPSTRIGAPIAWPWKVIAVGLNYRDHASESGMEPPTEPVLFAKTTNTVVGPFDDVLIPRASTTTDWEVELGVVIGREARYLQDEHAAPDYIAGYLISHDVSERTFQKERSGQWIKGKSCDTFNPLGPWLVTPDEIDDVQDLVLWLDVNGKRMQDGHTGSMLFGVNFLVHYISQFMTLEPGDVISTGTPAGVGMGRGRYLRPGDVVALGVEGLGCQKQTFRNDPLP